MLVQDGFGSAMSLRFYHVLVLQFRFLHGLFVRTGDETEVHIDARCILAGRRILQCMSFFGGCVIGLHSGMGVFTVV